MHYPPHRCRTGRTTTSANAAMAASFFKALRQSPAAAHAQLVALNGKVPEHLLKISYRMGEFATPIRDEALTLGVAIFITLKLTQLIEREKITDARSQKQCRALMIDYAAKKLSLDRQTLCAAAERVSRADALSSHTPRREIWLQSAERVVRARSYEELGRRLLTIAKKLSYGA